MSTPSVHDEVSLLQSLQTGNPHALEQLISLYQRELLYFTERLVQDGQVAEEIVNDGFLKIWNRRHGFASLPELRSFLFVVVRNASLDYLKSPKNKATGSVDEQTQLLPSDEDIEAQLVYTELLAAIHAEVQKLPNKQRQTFLLTFFEGLSSEEVAERLQISVNAVFINKHEALKTIRGIFKKQNSLFYLLFILYYL